MSRGLICDQCNDALSLNERGDDEAGESTAWLNLRTGIGSFDFCTRACLSAWLDEPEVADAMAVHAERIAEIVRIINSPDENESEGGNQ